MTIKEVLSRWFAIYVSAKRYHWKTSSVVFESDHELFDRIADVWSKGLFDQVVEQYYMGSHREQLNEVDDVFKSEDYEAPVMECRSTKESTQMARNLYKLVNELHQELDSFDAEDRGTNASLDEVSIKLGTALALLKGRLSYTGLE